MATFREDLFAYAKKKYKISPEYLWVRFPDYAVLRHNDNQKWFALVMDIPKSRLELNGPGNVDILNVKMQDSFLAEVLSEQPGFYRGYHISRGNWISILLDGTVSFEEVCHWLDESYKTTASKEEKHRTRPPKEWLVPANPKYYDVEQAFSRSVEINWKQGTGIKKGDTVFLYVAAPVSAILYKCAVTKTDIPYHSGGGAVHIRSLMRIKLLKRYSPDRFTFQVLKEEYGIFAVRGPRGIPEDLSQDLKL